MKIDKALDESMRRYKLIYKGTRKSYEINDPRPYVLSIDDDYNVDGKGKSILGINLNYYDGDKQDLINKINDVDNASGFKGFDAKVGFKRFVEGEKSAEWIASNKKKRYKTFIEEFPYLGKFIRRYKVSGPSGTGIQSKKRAFFK